MFEWCVYNLAAGVPLLTSNTYTAEIVRKTLWRTFSVVYFKNGSLPLVIPRKQLLIDAHVFEQLTPNAIMIVLDSQE